MLAIRTENGFLDLPADFTIDVEDTSPVFNDRGSQTVPLTVPATMHNLKVLGFQYRLDMLEQIKGTGKCTILDGIYIRNGTLNIETVSLVNGVEMNIGFDNSTAYEKWRNMRLENVPFEVEEYSSVTEQLEHCEKVLNGEADAPYAFFETVLKEDYNEFEENGTLRRKYYLLTVNRIYQEYDRQKLVAGKRQITLWENGKENKVNVPEGYGICPFLYAWFVLEKIFEFGGYKLINNPLKEDEELRRIVLISNLADGCTGKTIRLADFLPDCTIEEFLNALFARFGMTYDINSQDNSVRCVLIRNIFRETVRLKIELTGMEIERPEIRTAEPKQLVLSAGKDEFEMAKPDTENIQDFIKRKPQYIYRPGTLPEQMPPGVIQGYYGEPEVKRKLVYNRTLSRFEGVGKEEWIGNYDGTSSKGGLNKMPVCYNFFDWNRRTENVETQEITSPDVFVPVKFANIIAGYICPHFLKGPKHLYTKMEADNEEEVLDTEEEKTPLAFCFAFMKEFNKRPFGNLAPYDETGRVAQGTVTLLWQLKDGLFENFWKEYDAFLRHANRQVVFKFRLTMEKLLNWNMLEYIRFEGQRMITDKMEYSLPAEHGRKEAEVTMRTMSLIKPYNLEEEQKQVIIKMETE